MGIFTTGGYSGLATDIYSPVNESIDVSGYTNFHTLSLEAVAESERTYNNIMKSVGVAELRYFEEHGSEVIYEAGDISSFFEKIKMFFKKLIDKVKAIFHAFMAKLNSFIKSDKDFAKKYEKEFTEKWSNVSEDYDLINGYKFTNLDNVFDGEKSVYDLSAEQWKSIVTDTGWKMVSKNEFNTKNFIESVDYNKSNLGVYLEKQSSTVKRKNQYKFNKSDSDEITYTNAGNEPLEIKNTGYFDIEGSGGLLLEKIKPATTYIKDHREDIQDKIRGAILAKLGLGGNIGQTKADASEFTEKLTEGFRNNESSKSKLSKKDLGVSSLTIINDLKTASETKKAAEKSTKAITKAIEEDIKAIEEMQKNIRNDLSKKDPENKNQAAMLSYLSEITSLYRNHKEYCVQAKGAYLQALAQRSRQWKAVMTKVIAGGKKMNESYNYTNESTSYGSGSFLDSVTIK